MEVPRAQIDRRPPSQEGISPSPLKGMVNLTRLALLAISLSAQACPGAGYRGRTSGVDAGGDHSAADVNHTGTDTGDGISTTTDANGDRGVIVTDAGSVMDVRDAGGDCHEPDDVKGGGAGFCSDGKGGADAGNRD